jgi:hypothetical protein
MNYGSMELFSIFIKLREDYHNLAAAFHPAIYPKHTRLINRIGLQTENPLSRLIAECELMQSVSTYDHPTRRRVVDDIVIISDQTDFDRLN